MADLGQTLTRRLAQRLPRSRITPELSYGRHRGPACAGFRRAAICLALYRDHAGTWTVPLTLRPESLQHHGGQICLPGGRIERDEDAHQAAVREFEEELGTTPRILADCGQLSSQYVYASRNLVYPVVMIISPPQGDWLPDPSEVEKVIELPLSVILDRANRVPLIRRRSVRDSRGEVGSLTFRVTAIRYHDDLIWGATALILDQLAQLLLLPASGLR